jgi:pimeloyl-ACP methyl ester carboxylesterase
MPQMPFRDVIVFIPGITGSRLRRGEKILWGFSPRVLAKAIFGSKGFAEDLAPEPKDTADAVIPDLTLIPGFWKIDGYSKVTDTIFSQFDLEGERNFFTFPYDWRLDNRIAAEELSNRSQDWLREWRSTANSDAKLIIVAHSMGGLVARYFLEVLEGWKDTAALITFGTPFLGSLKAVEALRVGLRKGPISLTTLTNVVRGFPALYQLLPTYPCIDAGGPKLERFSDLTHPSFVDANLVTDAQRFHREISNAVESHLKDSGYVERRYRTSPIVGIDQKTFQFARIANGETTMLTEYQNENYGGDGTVPRVSATPLELRRQDKEMFANSKHGSIQNDDAVLTQLQGIVTGLTLPWERYQRRVEGPAVSLEVEDVYWDHEGVIVRTEQKNVGGDLYAVVADAATGFEVDRLKLIQQADGNYSADFGALGESNYQVTVSGAGIQPIQDSFVVVSQTASE